MNMKQQTTPEVGDIDTVMSDNEEIDPQPPQDIYNVFVATDFLSCSSSDSAKYKPAWIKAKVIRYYILSAGECPDACSRSLSIAPNHKEIAPIMVYDQRHFSKTICQCNYLT